MIMGTTIQYLSLDYFRTKVSEKVREMFGDAPVVSVKYCKTYALVYCIGNDGTENRMMVDYEEFIPAGQFGLAVRNLHLTS